MTRTANKGAIRAAATARRNRHAQRTPLPGDTSRPVKGNPTAEALKDEVAKDKAAKAQPKAKRDSRTFGAQTEDLAVKVQEMRDGGALWKTIAKELGLGAGKTGTSRARRLYRNGAGAPAPRRAAAKPRRQVATSATTAPEGDGGVPMMREVPAFHLQGRDTRKGAGKNRKPPRACGPVGEQQVRSLKKIWEGDGYTVTVVNHEPHAACCA
jgi:hypothetical protein